LQHKACRTCKQKKGKIFRNQNGKLLRLFSACCSFPKKVSPFFLKDSREDKVPDTVPDTRP
jgi:hypothetical protein